ncbi:ImmA/IrrE family metallo-endopeptidase [Candidatus Palauibacter irciniicola]|uniref:ImmA/IrrE family metallo-endopeptidase n=1 Tax=Candidatus Palauibacter irciniicola TaxID=3056733 RepID=UPI003B0250C2
MIRPDDSRLDPADLRAVEEQARRLLDRADAWNEFPVPVDDILSAAKVHVDQTGAFDPATIISYVKGKTADTRALVKTAISKVFGVYDATAAVIHIDDTLVEAKQTFLKLHEVGHHDLPWHRKVFRFFQDCRKTLDPTVADQFEREANNFARFLLFKDRAFAENAADFPLEIKTPMTLAKRFGASVYASVREYARTNPSPCLVLVLNGLEATEDAGPRATVRRIEPSPSFLARFGRPSIEAMTPDHPLWPVIPIGRRMTRPMSLSFTDANGQPHECVAEAFDTTYNILILLYPVSALNTTRVIVPSVVNLPS